MDIASLFDLGDCRLADAQTLGHLELGKARSLPQRPERLPHNASRVAIANPDGVNKFALTRHHSTPSLSKSLYHNIPLKEYCGRNKNWYAVLSYSLADDVIAKSD